MPPAFCPMTTVAAPVELVWSLLNDPRRYGEWWDAQAQSIEPEGPAVPGQHIVATARGLGRTWTLRFTVEGVDPSRHAIDILTEVPLGIQVRNAISCAPVDDSSTLLQFG